MVEHNDGWNMMALIAGAAGIGFLVYWPWRVAKAVWRVVRALRGNDDR